MHRITRVCTECDSIALCRRKAMIKLERKNCRNDDDENEKKETEKNNQLYARYSIAMTIQHNQSIGDGRFWSLACIVPTGVHPNKKHSPVHIRSLRLHTLIRKITFRASLHSLSDCIGNGKLISTTIKCVNKHTVQNCLRFY